MNGIAAYVRRELKLRKRNFSHAYDRSHNCIKNKTRIINTSALCLIYAVFVQMAQFVSYVSRGLFSSYKRPQCRRRFLHSDFGITMYSNSHETSEFTYKPLCNHNLSKFEVFIMFGYFRKSRIDKRASKNHRNQTAIHRQAPRSEF